MKRNFSWWRAALLFVCGAPHGVHADWLDEVGYRRWQTALGTAIPKGAGRGLSQVEVPNGTGVYAPVAGVGTVAGTAIFAGQSFVMKTGGQSGLSSHANEVAGFLYGTPGFNTRNGMASLASPVHCFDVNDWLAGGWLDPIGFPQPPPLVETLSLQNHSWVAPTAPVGEESEYNRALRTLDFAITRDDFLCIVGVSNDPAAAPPILLATAYNVISVGVSSGQHSHGRTVTLAGIDGPGRIKPDIVVPLPFTSYSTPTVSGAALALQEAAQPKGSNAMHHLTIKAALLAGATKEEFPSWTRSTTTPLDLTFGAGELNVFHSWQILHAEEQAPNAVSALETAWDWQSAAGNADYVVTVPATGGAVKFSAVMCWDRIITDASGPGFSPQSNVSNLSLSLARQTLSGFTIIADSNSAVDNVEHIFEAQLAPGTYRLRGLGAAGVPFALAWRATPVLPPSMIIMELATSIQFRLDNLIIGQPMKLQSSENLTAWTTALSFSPAKLTESKTLVTPNTTRRFYRLLY